VKWSRGDIVVLQEVWNGRVWAARPMTVVQDNGDAVELWFPFGTRWKRPTSPPTRARAANRGDRLAGALELGDWVFEDAEWDVSTLWSMQEGDWHALWTSWRPDGAHWGWYVNLQRPFARTPLGFETMDLTLDVTIEVDGTWNWKDEDEFETFVDRGLFDKGTALRAREEGLRVARRAERREPPFDKTPRWRPDPAWPQPELPEGWEEPCR
jgi:uncharacterized protein DUF402